MAGDIKGIRGDLEDIKGNVQKIESRLSDDVRKISSLFFGNGKPETGFIYRFTEIEQFHKTGKRIVWIAVGVAIPSVIFSVWKIFAWLIQQGAI